jgi:uncharacterized membrane protein
MPWRLTSPPTTTERIVGGICYFTFGMAGLLYIILSKTQNQSQLFKFHFYQSIVFWILATLVGYCATPLMHMVGATVMAVGGGAGVAIMQGIGIVAEILIWGFRLLLVYGAIMAFLGKFAEVPLISNIVRTRMDF